MSSVRTVLAAFSVICAICGARLYAETVEEQYETARSRCEALIKNGNIPAASDALYALRTPLSALITPDQHRKLGQQVAGGDPDDFEFDRYRLLASVAPKWAAALKDLVQLHIALAELCENSKQLEQAERAYVMGIAEVEQRCPKRYLVTVVSQGRERDVQGPDAGFAFPLRFRLVDFYLRWNLLAKARPMLAKEQGDTRWATGWFALKLAYVDARLGRSDYAQKGLKDFEGYRANLHNDRFAAEHRCAAGDVYAQLGRIGEARAEYQQALDSKRLPAERQKEVQTKLTNLGGAPKK